MVIPENVFGFFTMLHIRKGLEAREKSLRVCVKSGERKGIMD